MLRGDFTILDILTHSLSIYLLLSLLGNLWIMFKTNSSNVKVVDTGQQPTSTRKTQVPDVSERGKDLGQVLSPLLGLDLDRQGLYPNSSPGDIMWWMTRHPFVGLDDGSGLCSDK